MSIEDLVKQIKIDVELFSSMSQDYDPKDLKALAESWERQREALVKLRDYNSGASSALMVQVREIARKGLENA